MYCSNCGAELNENARFCQSCGQAVPGCSKPVVYSPERSDTAKPIEPIESPTPVLVWGILGLAFAVAGPLSFLGIIFSCIGLGKAKDYIAKYGTISKQANVGRSLSKAGLIAGIVVTVIVVLYIIFMIGLFGFLVRYSRDYR